MPSCPRCSICPPWARSAGIWLKKETRAEFDCLQVQVILTTFLGVMIYIYNEAKHMQGGYARRKGELLLAQQVSVRDEVAVWAIGAFVSVMHHRQDCKCAIIKFSYSRVVTLTMIRCRAVPREEWMNGVNKWKKGHRNWPTSIRSVLLSLLTIKAEMAVRAVCGTTTDNGYCLLLAPREGKGQ